MSRRTALAMATAITLPLAVSVAVLASSAGSAGAQTLQEALGQTYTNNPTLQTARAQLRVIDENVPQALAGWRPTVTLGGTAGYQDANARGKSGDVAVYQSYDRDTLSLQATATQPIYRGGRTVASTQRAENQVMAQRARLLATEQQVLSDAVQAYINVIRYQEEVRLNLNNVQVLQRQLDATNERFRVGEITRTDVAQAESRLAASRATRADAEGQLQSARAVFRRVIGSTPVSLTAPQPLRPPVNSAVEASQAAATNNPNVVAALFDEASARSLIDVQTGALLPQVSAQAQQYRVDNSNQPGTRGTGTSFTATVSVPLYQGGAEYATVRQARQDASRYRQIIDDQRRTSAQQAASAWETLVSNRATVESNRTAIRAAEVALDGVQREAVVGSRTTLDVLNQEQELLNNRVALVRALASNVTSSYSLAAAVGRLTARDLALPVPLYDMTAYYKAVRNRWIGLGSDSETIQSADAAPVAATVPATTPPMAPPSTMAPVGR